MSPGATDISVDGSLPSGALLARDFFDRPSDQVAPDLIGKILWAEGVGGGRLTEVEAYLPEGDPACHAARGRTRRNAAMFGPPGHIYVYLSYGVHVLLNLVCDRESIGSAVLVRSFEPAGDTEHLRRNRAEGRRGNRESVGAVVGGRRDERQLSCGPGRVGQALGLGLGLNGLALGEASGLFVIDDGSAPEVGRTARIGISRGEKLRLRYYMIGNNYVTHQAGPTTGGR
jgi:DNA-3-methyladenine glycosylase